MEKVIHGFSLSPETAREREPIADVRCVRDVSVLKRAEAAWWGHVRENSWHQSCRSNNKVAKPDKNRMKLFISEATPLFLQHILVSQNLSNS